MSFTGNEKQEITVKQASEMNAKFRKTHPHETQGLIFGEHILKKILKQKHCKGIRFYFAIDDNDQLSLTFAGVDKDANDILDLVGDTGVRCPPTCGEPNPLNS